MKFDNKIVAIVILILVIIILLYRRTSSMTPSPSPTPHVSYPPCPSSTRAVGDGINCYVCQDNHPPIYSQNMLLCSNSHKPMIVASTLAEVHVAAPPISSTCPPGTVAKGDGTCYYCADHSPPYNATGRWYCTSAGDALNLPIASFYTPNHP